MTLTRRWNCGSLGGNLTLVGLRRVRPTPPSEQPGQVPARSVRPFQRHVVDARAAPGVAAQQPRQRHPAAAPQAEPLDDLIGIDRAGWQVTAIVTRSEER